MVLRAGEASAKVRPLPGDLHVGDVPPVDELDLDVPVEIAEALLARQLGLNGVVGDHTL